MREVILVTGGAGYVGSHVAKKLLDTGHKVLVLDNLSTGHAEVVSLFAKSYGPQCFGFEQIDLRDEKRLADIFKTHQVEGIIDFAAKSIVPESQRDPQSYFENNVLTFRNLALLAVDQKIPLVKSSTAATYGDPTSFVHDHQSIRLSEDYQQGLICSDKLTSSQMLGAAIDLETFADWYGQELSQRNPCLSLTNEDYKHLMIVTNIYGATKVCAERMSKHLEARGLRSVCLRYFNACGADPSGSIGEDHQPETHLIPIVLQVALGLRSSIEVFGTDYPTPDGTCIRDYVDVPDDLAEAHIRSLQYLRDGGESGIYNLGTGNGYSVGRIIDATRKITGKDIPTRHGQRRSGDPAILIADSSRIERDLGWKAKVSIEDSIKSAWKWHHSHPNGFGKR